MTTTSKMTYVAALTYALENLTDAPADVVEKLTALRDQTTKRNASATAKPTAKQVENEGVKQTILDLLTERGKMTVSELMEADATMGAMTNQRVSALVRQLLLAGKVERIEDKRKAYFQTIEG